MKKKKRIVIIGNKGNLEDSIRENRVNISKIKNNKIIAETSTNEIYYV